VAEIVLTVVRGAVALGCGAAAVVALTHWLVRRGVLSPFGAVPRAVRQLAGPVVRATERRVVARGGNPQDAPYWLLGALVLGGLVLLSLTQWVLGYLWSARGAFGSGPRGVLRFVVLSACDVVALALFLRAIGSWFGVGRWTRWMRPAYVVTDWLVLPLGRVIPPVGMFDITPLVAMVIVWFVRNGILIRLL
jgi:YggT family protein